MQKQKRFITLMLVCVMLMSNTVFAASTPPTLVAETAILMEASTKKIIYEKNIHQKMYPASMTKILTALIVLEHFSPEALITVGDEINEITLDSSKAGHVRGETLSVENLIRGLIIPSGNDSANVLAMAVAKKVKNQDITYEESQTIFTDLMNKKAIEIGAKESHFSNAHGYHDENHYSTAYDMALISIEAMKNPIIKKIAGEKNYTGNGAGNTLEIDTNLKIKDYAWRSHNLLIADNEYQYEYATGIKTGFTNEAGSCVSASAEKDGVNLIAVVMKSVDPDRWIDAKSLFEYGYENFAIENLESANTPVETVTLTNHNRLNGDTLDVIVKEDVKEYLAKEDVSKLVKVVTYDKELLVTSDKKGEKSISLKAPIAKDTKVGTVSYELDGKSVKTVDVFAKTEVEKKTIGSILKYFFKNIFEEVFSLKGLIVVLVIIAILLLIWLFMKMKKKKNRYPRYKFRKNNSRRRF